ncbi:MAG TPA: hypothetical protein VH054_28145 [Polyangiaceae bacterium]|nr:hypothetical protein [Polyangiaceae bacterium]
MSRTFALVALVFAPACAASPANPAPESTPDAAVTAAWDAAPAVPDAAPDVAVDAPAPVVDAGSTSAAQALIDAKIFGYMFGDGDFYTDAPAPVDPSFYAAAPDVVADVIDLGCNGGYAVAFENKAFTCGDPKPTVKGSITIKAFHWPNGGDLDKLVAQDQLEAFMSGLFIGEGSRTGLCDDQYTNNPVGHYATDASCAAHVELVKDALSRAGFTTAHVSAKNDAACSGDSCREARIDASEFCKLAAPGYTFVKYDRVPGSVASGSTYDAPAPCK